MLEPASLVAAIEDGAEVTSSLRYTSMLAVKAFETLGNDPSV